MGADQWPLLRILKQRHAKQKLIVKKALFCDCHHIARARSVLKGPGGGMELVLEMSEGVMSHDSEFDGLDPTEKAGIEAALNRGRALAAQIENELHNKRSVGEARPPAPAPGKRNAPPGPSGRSEGPVGSRVNRLRGNRLEHQRNNQYHSVNMSCCRHVVGRRAVQKMAMVVQKIAIAFLLITKLKIPGSSGGATLTRRGAQIHE
jgi:hypothetical protein